MLLMSDNHHYEGETSFFETCVTIAVLAGAVWLLVTFL